jgi:hypothetical protein
VFVAGKDVDVVVELDPGKDVGVVFVGSDVNGGLVALLL